VAVKKLNALSTQHKLLLLETNNN